MRSHGASYSLIHSLITNCLNFTVVHKRRVKASVYRKASPNTTTATNKYTTSVLASDISRTINIITSLSSVEHIFYRLSILIALFSTCTPRVIQLQSQWLAKYKIIFCSNEYYRGTPGEPRKYEGHWILVAEKPSNWRYTCDEWWVLYNGGRQRVSMQVQESPWWASICERYTIMKWHAVLIFAHEKEYYKSFARVHASAL